MIDDLRPFLTEIIDSYGIKILEDPDRLAQFLDEKSSLMAEDTFHLSFALRFLLKCGWRPTQREYAKRRTYYEKALVSQLGYNPQQAAEIMEIISWIMEMEFGDSGAGERFGADVAVPGNLKTIIGGISNKPRAMNIRKKSLYNGITLLAALAALLILFFQVSNQRAPAGDELCIAFFAPMSGAAARLSHVQIRAAQLAVENINGRGLLPGDYKLKVIGYDLPANPDAARAVVEKAMKDRNMLVMALGRASSMPTVAPLADRLRAPLVLAAPLPLGGALLDNSSMPYLYSFSLAADTGARGHILSYFATQALQKKKIAIYYNSLDKASTEMYQSVRKWAVGFGADVIAVGAYRRGSSHTVAMQSFADSGAEILILPHAGEAIDEILKQRAAANPDMPILADGYTHAIAQRVGAALAGSWWINEVTALDPRIASVLRAYRSLYNEDCPPEDVTAAILAYDSIMWIAAAFQNAPGFRGEAIRHTLLATRNLALAHATLTIDPRTHMPLNKASSIIHCETDKGIFQRRFIMDRN